MLRCFVHCYLFPVYLLTLLFATPQAGIIPNWIVYKNIRELLSSLTEVMKKLHESLKAFLKNNVCLDTKYVWKNLCDMIIQ